MAEGAWIPVFDSIWTHPKTAKLARELRVTNEVAAAKFLRLLAWAREAAESGELGHVDPAAIAEAVGLRRDSDGPVDVARRGQRFLEALIAAGFVTRRERDEGGNVTGRHAVVTVKVTGWDDGPGKLVERRRKERQKKAEQRAREKTGALSQPVPRDTSGRPEGQGATVPRDIPRLSLDRAEESRADKTYPPPPRPASAGTKGTNGAGRNDPRDEAELLIATASAPWSDALVRIRAQLPSAQAFVTWYGKTELEVEGRHYVVKVPNAFAMEWLRSRYVKLTRDALIEVTRHSELVLTFALSGGPREPDVVELDATGGGGG